MRNRASTIPANSISTICELCATERACFAELNGIALCASCLSKQVKKIVKWCSTGHKKVNSRNQRERTTYSESDHDQIVTDPTNSRDTTGGRVVYGDAISA